jgi:hypothetical protein
MALGIALLGVVATLGPAVTERRHELAVRAALVRHPDRTALGGPVRRGSAFPNKC